MRFIDWLRHWPTHRIRHRRMTIVARRESSRAVISRLHHATENLEERLVLAAPHPLELSSLDGTLGFQIKGVNDGDFTGATVSTAGDVNGDGFEDLIIAAPGADPSGRSDAGVSYVVFGKASGLGSQFFLSGLDGTNGFRIIGRYLDEGTSSGGVSSAGDVNGDGYGDLLVSGSGNISLNSDAADAYVIFGKANGFSASLELTALDGTNGFRIKSSVAVSHSSRILGLGDVNGDGFDDIAISNNYSIPRPNSVPEDKSVCDVVVGKPGVFPAFVDLTLNPNDWGFRLTGDGFPRVS